jgi:phosphatidate cytidylyltransferase
MVIRLLSAAVGIPLFLGFCLWGRFIFAGGVLVLAIIGLVEMVQAYRVKGRLPNVILSLFLPAVSVWMWLTFSMGADAPLWIRSLNQPAVMSILLGAVILGLAVEVFNAARTGEMRAGQNIGDGLLMGLYISLFGGMAWLRADDRQALHGLFPHMERGAAAVLLTVFSVWATDSFAYFVGRAVGKTKLAPKLSPGKTIEGAAGGLAAGLVFGALFGRMFLGDAALGLVVGGIAGVFGQVGDLFESALKRELDIKDFGGIMPGHGGVLDRFDSLLFVAPIVALLLPFWPK